MDRYLVVRELPDYEFIGGPALQFRMELRCTDLTLDIEIHD